MYRRSVQLLPLTIPFCLSKLSKIVYYDKSYSFETDFG